MILHVLNGDALLPNFKRCSFLGDVMIWRECLVEGPVSAKTDEEFWEQRSNYICETYQVTNEEYHHQVIEKLYKIENPARYSEINLWFEFDLFCQANLFFILQRLAKHTLNHTTIYWVQPEQQSVNEYFSGFGNTNNQQLRTYFSNRLLLTSTDLGFGTQVWEAYAQNKKNLLHELTSNPPPNFHFFAEVFRAHLQRSNDDESSANRIEKRLLEAIKNGVDSEIDLLHRFWETESIYGLGDLQVVNYINNLQQKNWIDGLELTSEGEIALNKAF
ncbi:hypothetical protein [Solitalea canadensis]|uniref:DUF1835 domain-containing protein n=1 Tax=Solitalea canadensis (strain ATCC 29591 / DSM 3403 / JCM 21819 / LMG 8368 / NBRC 15130 / NCIMB 12057 / USAM 9D) TaxID=929556 RepID=H8KX74_SOLCM|nr:hypothetical protein [Solitalea canadensis]AFD08403.1 hypothetical protein Solca_3396 [Solitalea canadensis DSM 3403]